MYLGSVSQIRSNFFSLLILLCPAVAIIHPRTHDLTMTVTLGPIPFNLSPTTTVFKSTMTTTIFHDCGTNTAVQVTRLKAGHGPMRPKPTATVTEELQTHTAHHCRPSSDEL
ncbi:hypothetical protein MMC10_006905 [Thelotrema lepadinum]|nr:hypothetical protein [Thelotrema lepadinum]